MALFIEMNRIPGGIVEIDCRIIRIGFTVSNRLVNLVSIINI